MVVLESERLYIRPFVDDDLTAVYALLDGPSHDEGERLRSLREREAWLRWSIDSVEQLSRLHQPPYGDRAIVLRETNDVVGVCGFVPCLAPFALLTSESTGDKVSFTPEI